VTITVQTKNCQGAMKNILIDKGADFFMLGLKVMFKPFFQLALLFPN
jgi:hypothetical protein